jgi:hypothetical protein
VSFRIEVRGKRLVAARIHALRDAEDARRYAMELGAFAGRIAARSPVLCADHRPVTIYAPVVADELARLFSKMNDVLARVAILGAPSNATLVMQLGRIVREANNPKRQLFTDAAKARTFLEEELVDPVDREPLAEFVGA